MHTLVYKEFPFLTYANRFVNLALLAIMAVVCGIVDAILEQRDYPKGAPWLFNDNRSDDNPHINGLVTFANGLITYVWYTRPSIS